MPASPFLLGTMILGAFVLLPYLALRNEPSKPYPSPGWARLLESRLVGVAFTCMTLLLVRWGLSHGHAAAYVDMFRRNSFVHFMTFDFLFQALASGSVLGSDMERRGMQSRSLFWFVTMLPVIGLCLCLSIRPALPRAQA